MSTKETRSFELRASADEGVLTGRAVAYNTLSSPMPSHEKGVMFREQVKPGAFAKSLASDDQTADFNHDDKSLPLGRKSAGTLKLVDSPTGLDFRIQLDAKQQAHRELYSAVKRGDVRSCSWAFVPNDDGEKWSEDPEQRGQFIRTLTSCKLFAISIVNNPAYPVGTSVSARAAVQSFSAQLFRGKKSVNQVRAETAARNKISVTALEDAELRLKARQQAAVMDAQNKTEDAALRAKAESLRQGGGFEVASEGGQASDPTQSLRCKANSVSSSPSEHRKAAMAHRAYRDRAKDSDTYAQHDTAAQDHDDAADGDTSAAIRCVANCRRTK
jgi:HK97 family phage prohead protease